MGTGLGPESYAIIEQGRIGQMLSSKPQDRRAVIEEAAGITKFKTRKRLAEAKLEGAKQNLARVFDILEEVTRQVNSLKRQASKARRYAELKTELDAGLRVVLAGRYRLLERDAAKTAIELNLAAAELQIPGRAGGREGKGARKPPGRLLRTRAPAHRSAPAAWPNRTWKPSARAGGWNRRPRKPAPSSSASRRPRRNRRSWGRALRSLDGEVAGHQAALDELEAEIAQARGRMLEINQQREALQTVCASASGPSKPGARSFCASWAKPPR